MGFSLNQDELNNFARSNKEAMILMFRGTSDYVGCRCCLLNSVFSGLELGAQAVEKHLKAMFLFALPESKVRGFGHNLQTLVVLVGEKGIADLSSHMETITQLHSHYQARYPDNPNRPSFASTEELYKIDELMLDILEKMPVPEEILLRSGVYSRVLQSSEGRPVFADEQWLLANNHRLLAKLPMLIQRNKEWSSFAQS